MRKRFSIKDVSSSRLSIQRQEVEALVQQVWYLKDRCSSTVSNRITLCFFMVVLVVVLELVVVVVSALLIFELLVAVVTVVFFCIVVLVV